MQRERERDLLYGVVYVMWELIINIQKEESTLPQPDYQGTQQCAATENTAPYRFIIIQ